MNARDPATGPPVSANSPRRRGCGLHDHILSTGEGPVVLPAIVAPEWTPRELRVRAARTPAPAAVPATNGTARTGGGTDAAEQAEAWLIGLLADELGFDRARLAADVPISDYGTDSIMMVQILRKVGAELDVDLDPSVLVDHPTVESFVGWLTAHHGQALAAAFGGTTPAAAQDRSPVTVTVPAERHRAPADAP